MAIPWEEPRIIAGTRFLSPTRKEQILSWLMLKAQQEETFKLTEDEIHLLMGNIQVAQTTGWTINDADKWGSTLWTEQLFEIFSRIKAGKKVTFRDIIITIEHNSSLIYYIGPTVLNYQLPWTISWMLKDIPDETRGKVKAEVTKFLTDNSAIVSKWMHVLELKKLLRDIEIIFIFLWKVDYEWSDAQVNKKTSSMHPAMLALHNIYFNETTSPIVKKFFQDYFVDGKFPVLRQTVESNKAVASKIAPPYQALITNPQVLDSFIKAFWSPEKITWAFKNIALKLEEVMEVIESSQLPANYQPKRFKWTARWRRDEWKQEFIKAALTEIAQDFLEIFWPVLKAVQEFLKTHPETWQYFLKNGTRIHEKQPWEQSSGILSPDTILWIFFGEWLDLNIDNLSSEQFLQQVIQNPEVIWWLITGFFLQVYWLWSKADNSREIRDLLWKSGVYFWPWKFRNALRVTVTWEKKWEVQQSIGSFRNFLKILWNPEIKWETLQEQWKILLKIPPK